MALALLRNPSMALNHAHRSSRRTLTSSSCPTRESNLSFRELNSLTLVSIEATRLDWLAKYQTIPATPARRRSNVERRISIFIGKTLI